MKDLTIEEKIIVTGIGAIVVTSIIWMYYLIKYNPVIM
jgi:hypothetical protein